MLLILGFFAMCAFSKVYKREEARAVRAERHPENLINMPAAHFRNRGGVLMKKEFDGFTKYFTSQGEHDDWFNMAFPKTVASLKSAEE